MKTKAKVRERRGQPSHREDLRGELLAAAVAFVAREGHESLSMRRLADEVGVASSAPYHHFADRRALLVAVALEGYKAMLLPPGANAMGEPLDPRARLVGEFRSFIDFALAHPNLFTLMYESELVRPVLAPELAAAQEQGYQVLRAEISQLTAHLDDQQRAVRIATIWSAIFGFAIQSNRSMLRSRPFEPEPALLAPKIIEQALRLLD